MGQSKSKKLGKVNGDTLIAGIDVGKKINYGYFRAPDGQDIKPFAFHNFRSGFEVFWTRLVEFEKKHGLEAIVVGFESTGPYAEPLIHFLRGKKARLVQINPMHTKRLKELTGNSPNKTDEKDPRVIADVIALGHALTLVIPEGPAAELRRLSQARERAVKARTALSNQLQHLLFVVFPELCWTVKNMMSKTALHLIENFPTPESILSLGVEGLRAILGKVSRGRLGEEQARLIFAGAQESVGIREGRDAILLEINHLVFRIRSESNFIEGVENQMRQYLEQVPCSRSILSIKGVGEVMTAGLIGEVGDFGKFTTISEIMKLAGLDLYEISSGSKKGQRRISKRGRSYLRKILFFAVVNMVKTEGILHGHYRQMVDRGMPRIKALIAMCRKALRIIFAIVRDNAVYERDHQHMPGSKLTA
ncbi:MAG: IS110 family transposase [Syntrophobacteraceae bacterium]|nr:IS110 family transposase [Syntrophobacteraceae bacterium]